MSSLIRVTGGDNPNALYGFVVYFDDRVVFDWIGNIHTTRQLYNQGICAINQIFGLIEQDHYWAWDGAAREIIWDYLLDGRHLEGSAQAVMVWWIIHYSKDLHDTPPVVQCSFRRRFDVTFLGNIEAKIEGQGTPFICNFITIRPRIETCEAPPEFVKFSIN